MNLNRIDTFLTNILSKLFEKIKNILYEDAYGAHVGSCTGHVHVQVHKSDGCVPAVKTVFTLAEYQLETL